MSLQLVSTDLADILNQINQLKNEHINSNALALLVVLHCGEFVKPLLLALLAILLNLLVKELM